MHSYLTINNCFKRIHLCNLYKCLLLLCILWHQRRVPILMRWALWNSLNRQALVNERAHHCGSCYVVCQSALSCIFISNAKRFIFSHVALHYCCGCLPFLHVCRTHVSQWFQEWSWSHHSCVELSACVLKLNVVEILLHTFSLLQTALSVCARFGQIYALNKTINVFLSPTNL